MVNQTHELSRTKAKERERERERMRRKGKAEENVPTMQLIHRRTCKLLKERN